MAIYVLLVGKDPSFWNFELLKNRPPTHSERPFLATAARGHDFHPSSFETRGFLYSIYTSLSLKEKIYKNPFGGGEGEKSSYTRTHTSFQGESFCPSSLPEERPSGNLCYFVPRKMLYMTIPYNDVAIVDQIKANKNIVVSLR